DQCDRRHCSRSQKVDRMEAAESTHSEPLTSCRGLQVAADFKLQENCAQLFQGATNNLQSLRLIRHRSQVRGGFATQRRRARQRLRYPAELLVSSRRERSNQCQGSQPARTRPQAHGIHKRSTSPTAAKNSIPTVPSTTREANTRVVLSCAPSCDIK